MDIINNILRKPKSQLRRGIIDQKLNKNDKNEKAVTVSKEDRALACKEEDIVDLMSKSIILVQTIVDGNDLTTIQLAKQVASLLDLEAVFKLIV